MEACVDSDEVVDSEGNSCSWYEEFPFLCGTFDYGEFVALEMCCSCNNTNTKVSNDPQPRLESIQISERYELEFMFNEALW